MRKGREGSVHGTWILFYGIFFALGICITNLWKTEIVDKTGFLGEYTLLCMNHVKIDYMDYFMYLLQKRAGMTVVLAILSSTYLGIICIYLYIGWLGLAAGIFLTGAGIRYGTKGILLFLGGMIPHQIILLPCGIIFICWCYRMCTALYYPRHCSEPVYGSKKQFIMRKLIQLPFFIGVVIIGCLLECYVNPYIFTKILKIF